MVRYAIWVTIDTNRKSHTDFWLVPISEQEAQLSRKSFYALQHLTLLWQYLPGLEFWSFMLMTETYQCSSQDQDRRCRGQGRAQGHKMWLCGRDAAKAHHSSFPNYATHRNCADTVPIVNLRSSIAQPWSLIGKSKGKSIYIARFL